MLLSGSQSVTFVLWNDDYLDPHSHQQVNDWRCGILFDTDGDRYEVYSPQYEMWLWRNRSGVQPIPTEWKRYLAL